MVTFPNCKINLGLNIVAKRTDGYHNLETVFLPLAFIDVLEIIRNENSEPDCSITLHGLPVEGSIENNLCYKAYQLLKKDYPQISNVKIHLLKNIFMGAGLGGGSADAAFTLQTLNDIFYLRISSEQFADYALQLGSDCPFFLINKPCFATGRGEQFQQLRLNLSGYKIVLVHPDIHINTGWAFQQIQPHKPASSLQQLIQQPIEEWKDAIINDFEKPVCEKYPDIRKIKELLYENGAVYASMTGSGSTVFGLFNRQASFNKYLFNAWSVIETSALN